MVKDSQADWQQKQRKFLDLVIVVVCMIGLTLIIWHVLTLEKKEDQTVGSENNADIIFVKDVRTGDTQKVSAE